MTFGKIGATPTVKNWTARDYVQNGLIWILDGIENSAYGKHEAVSGVAKSWNNLVDGGQTYFRAGWAGGINFHSNYASLIQASSGDSYGGYRPSVEATFGTVSTYAIPSQHTEVVFSVPDVLTTQDHFSGGYAMNGIRVGGGYIGTGNGRGYSIANDEIVSLSFSSAGNSNTYYKNGIDSPVPQTEVNKLTGGTNNWTLLAGGYQWTTPCKFFCVRFYNRALTADEIAHNYKIDKLRFGL